MSSSFRIAVIAGDGIGREVIPAGIAAIEAAAKGSGLTLVVHEFPWGCDFYKAHGRMMDEDGFEQLGEVRRHLSRRARRARAFPDGISAALILAIRQRFDQYVNLRPMRLLAGLHVAAGQSHAPPTSTWSASARTRKANTPAWAAASTAARRTRSPQQTGVFTRHGIERIVRYGFEMAVDSVRARCSRAPPSPTRLRTRW